MLNSEYAKLFNYGRKGGGAYDILRHKVVSIVPQYVCDIPKVTTSSGVLDTITVSAFVQAITNTWTLARDFGVASIRLSEGGVKITRNRGKNAYVFYGVRDYFNDRRDGYSIVSPEVSGAICSYRLIKDYLEERVAHSYAELITIAGGLSLKSDDDVIAKVMTDYQQSGRSMVAPTGSTQALSATSLVDLERVIDIYYNSIAHEANIPIWLWKEIPPATVHDASERAQYLQKQFKMYVEPALDWLLSNAGYEVVEITPPIYRDEMYKVGVEQMIANVRTTKGALDQATGTNEPE